MNDEFAVMLMPFLSALRVYHRYDAVGLDNIPLKGPMIVACNHSLATYDICLLMTEIYERRGRFPRSLIDRLFYKIPWLGSIMEKTGGVLGTHENGLTLLKEGELLFIAPGGMRESLRPMSERYQILWERRKGFVRLSIESGAPIVLAACPKADDIYDVYPSAISSWFYKTLRVPVFLARGFGMTPIPKPVKLRHFLSEPIKPPKKKKDPEEYELQVDKHHKRVVARMQRLISEAIAHRDGGVKLLP